MEHRFDRAAAVLSPLEESSAEVSRDSGIVSQSASSLSMVSEALSSGTVSQSPSFGAAVAQSPSSAAGETQPEQTQDDELLRHTAITYSSYIRANAEEEVREQECCACLIYNNAQTPVYCTHTHTKSNQDRKNLNIILYYIIQLG